MFFYLSFLRPPPKTASLRSDGVSITPQIANDLRTELLDDRPTDISYVWQCLRGTSSAGGSSTAPKHLTTYSPPTNTYRSCTVPLPPNAKSGEIWRLGLLSPPAKDVDGTIPLQEDQIVGVWSEGIEINSGGAAPTSSGGKAKGRGNAEAGKQDKMEKQTRITRSWKITSSKTVSENKLGQKRDVEGNVREHGRTSSDTLRVVEQTSFDLDKKIWDSGLALSAWLFEVLESKRWNNVQHIEELHHRLGHQEGISASSSTEKRIVEIGAGTGLVAIALAACLRRQLSRAGDGEVEEAHEESPKFDILTTDLPSAIPLIEENIALNKHLWLERSTSMSVRADVLDWDEAIDPAVLISQPKDAEQPSTGTGTGTGTGIGIGIGIDLVIAADVTYNTDSFPMLVKTLESLLIPRTEAHKTHPPLLVLAYKQRDLGERELWPMLEKIGIKLDKVLELPGHEVTIKPPAEEGENREGQIEIWFGRMCQR